MSQGCWDSISFWFAALFTCLWPYWPSEWLRCRRTQQWNSHHWEWDSISAPQHCSSAQLGSSCCSFKLKQVVDESLTVPPVNFLLKPCKQDMINHGWFQQSSFFFPHKKDTNHFLKYLKLVGFILVCCQYIEVVAWLILLKWFVLSDSTSYAMIALWGHTLTGKTKITSASSFLEASKDRVHAVIFVWQKIRGSCIYS